MSETIETIDLDMWKSDPASDQLVRYRNYITHLLDEDRRPERHDMEQVEMWLLMVTGRVRRMEDQIEAAGIDPTRRACQRPWWRRLWRRLLR